MRRAPWMLTVLLSLLLPLAWSAIPAQAAESTCSDTGDTQTTNLSLCLPAHGSPNWDAKLRDNYNTIAGAVPNILVAESLSGADMGAKIQAAHDSASCVTGNCIIDARGPSAKIITTLTITKKVEILTCGAWTVNGTVTFSDTVFQWKGCGRQQNTFTWNSATSTIPMFDLQAAGGPGTVMSGFSVKVASGKQLYAAFRIANKNMLQSVLSSGHLFRDILTDGHDGSNYGKMDYGFIWDALVNPITNTVSGSLNNTTSPVAIAVSSCVGYPTGAAFSIVIDEAGNQELATVASNGCSGTTLTMTRPYAATHAGTVTIKHLMNQNNDIGRINDAYIANYKTAGILIYGDQSREHTFTRTEFVGGQQANTTGIRTGILLAHGGSLGGGAYSCYICGGGGNDTDHLWYNASGPFNIIGGNSEESVRWIETPASSGGLGEAVVAGNRFSTTRLASASPYPIYYDKSGGISVLNNQITAFTQANYLYIKSPDGSVANNGSGLCRVITTNSSGTATAHGLSTGDFVQISAVGIDPSGTHECNGLWKVTTINATTIDLQGSAFSSAYLASSGNAFTQAVKLYCGTAGRCEARGNTIYSASPDPFHGSGYWRTSGNRVWSADATAPNNGEVTRDTWGPRATFTDGDTTPSVRGGNLFAFANTAPTTITAIDDMAVGQVYIIGTINGNTTISFSGGNIRGNSNQNLTLSTYQSLLCLSVTAPIAECVIGVDYSAPGAIGSTTPNTGAFTTLSASTSLTVGGGTAATKHLSATGTVGNGGANIAANSCITDTITVTGAATGDTVVLGPPSDIEASLTWGGAVTAASTVTVRLCNPTAGALASADKTWRADTWTH